MNYYTIITVHILTKMLTSERSRTSVYVAQKSKQPNVYNIRTLVQYHETADLMLSVYICFFFDQFLLNIGILIVINIQNNLFLRPVSHTSQYFCRPLC